MTRTIKTGTALPAQCSSGDLFFRTNAAAGANLYACTATNIWTVMGNMAHSHNAGGDVSGDLAAMSIVGLQNRAVSAAAPAAGQVLAWNATAGQWEPQTAASGGGSGASSGAQLSDLTAVRTTNTTLVIGAQCTSAAPCNVRFGNTVYRFTAAASVQLSGTGTGTVYIYINRNGALTVGHNVSLACSGCTAEAANDFPADAVPLFRWTTLSGAWEGAGGADMRAFLSTQGFLGGSGIAVARLTGAIQVGVDPAVVGLRTALPGSSGAACTAGNWAADSSFYYLCVAENTWRRLALSVW